jgi:hypothetical protein
MLIHLLVYSLIQNEFLIAYMSVWQSTLSWSIFALVEMMSSEFICLFWLIYESYSCGGLINLLIHLMPILAHDYLFVILLCSLCEDSLLFYKSWHNGVHNCLNTCLYALWSTLILNLMHSISFFSWFVFDEFITKGREYGHKVDWTFC